MLILAQFPRVIFSSQGKPLQYASDSLRLKYEYEFVALLTYCNLVLVNNSLCSWLKELKRLKKIKINRQLSVSCSWLKTWKETSQLILAETIPT